jgi:hypothetical protein
MQLTPAMPFLQQPLYGGPANSKEEVDLFALFQEDAENTMNSHNTPEFESSNGTHGMTSDEPEEYFHDVIQTLQQLDHVYPAPTKLYDEQEGFFIKGNRKRAYDEISDVTVSTSYATQDSPPKKVRKFVPLIAPTEQKFVEKRSGKWSKDEDEMLRKAVRLFEEKQWKKISILVPGRDHVQCLQRWQ